MHSQQILSEVSNNLYSNPQKCIKILSAPLFLNNLFQPQLQQLTKLLESNLTKMSKQNRNISFNEDNTNNKELNAQLVVCAYSIIIIKSTSKSMIAAEQSPVFNTKLAIDTLNKIHRQTKQQDIKKIVTGLLLKIPNFTNHKSIVRQIDPSFVSFKTLKRSLATLKSQCPNLIEEKLITYKDTQWGDLLSYKPFKLDDFVQNVNKLTQTESIANNANNLIQIRHKIQTQYKFLQRRINLIQRQQFLLYQFCQKFTQIFRLKLSFQKVQKNYSTHEKNQNTS